jgi:hypothetical protein
MVRRGNAIGASLHFQRRKPCQKRENNPDTNRGGNVDYIKNPALVEQKRRAGLFGKGQCHSQVDEASSRVLQFGHSTKVACAFEPHEDR